MYEMFLRTYKLYWTETVKHYQWNFPWKMGRGGGSPGTTNKIDRHGVAEILLKEALNTIKHLKQIENGTL